MIMKAANNLFSSNKEPIINAISSVSLFNQQGKRITIINALRLKLTSRDQAVQLKAQNFEKTAATIHSFIPECFLYIVDEYGKSRYLNIETERSRPLFPTLTENNRNTVNLYGHTSMLNPNDIDPIIKEAKASNPDLDQINLVGCSTMDNAKVLSKENPDIKITGTKASIAPTKGGFFTVSKGPASFLHSCSVGGKTVSVQVINGDPSHLITYQNGVEIHSEPSDQWGIKTIEDSVLRNDQIEYNKTYGFEATI